MNENAIQIAKETFDIEIETLYSTKESIGHTFCIILEMILSCKGKVFWTGIGKSGHIARKCAATMSSLGTSAFYLHPAEALHGDLGAVNGKDIGIIISFSGESDEITKLIPSLKIIGCKLIAITGTKESFLAKNCDVAQILPNIQEACHLELAPTSSTTAELVYGDALAIALSVCKGMDREHFALYHPGGKLGKTILVRVRDLMIGKNDSAIVYAKSSFKEAVAEMCMKSSRVVVVLDDDKLVGIMTDGDVRRRVLNDQLNETLKMEEICHKSPVSIRSAALAADAFRIMRDNNFSALPVVGEDGTFEGVIGFRELMDAGMI